MEALAQYGSGDEEEAAAPQLLKPLQVVSAAPEVAEDVAARRRALEYWDPAQKRLHYNPTHEQMHAPLEGPANPFSADGLSAGQKNHRLGFIEAAHVKPVAFHEQLNTFNAYGYGADPATNATLVSSGSAAVAVGAKRKKKGASNPWFDKLQQQVVLTEEERERQREFQAAREEAAKRAAEGGAAAPEHQEDSTKFHGKEETDYAGRSWIDAPKDAKADNAHCYIPKKLIHTYTGHTKGVNKIQFFPGTGHLLLSGSLDGKVKIWDVASHRNVMRTYMGHSQGVRDICFSNDGRRFLSCSYDRNIKLWDTESGKVLGTFSTGKVPLCVTFNPDDDKQHVVLAGMQDKKIVQWDMNTGNQEQEYDQHLGAVNTITFVDDNRRFVTSSDDKSLRVWEFGIPVVIKYIADPSMHSMPAIALSHNRKWMCCQSLDNQIVTYSTKERFRVNRKKTFKGHTNGGYACQVAFSPDDRFVCSGDGDGKAFFWDWKTTKIFKSFRAHDGVCIGMQWHPLETSKVATCGWDGVIKYWD
mmetsp:Transcript_4879/g.17698  ORF Transcript_4879/g.17698 Transcript_4879/m.17698 type:complete len:528 (+) Transcript_4879:241-1824(+)